MGRELASATMRFLLALCAPAVVGFGCNPGNAPRTTAAAPGPLNVESPKAPAAARPSKARARPPRGIGLRTPLAPPLVVYRDGSTTLPEAKNMARVSDHYSACFVTRDERVACWGVSQGGTWDGVATRDPDVGLEGVVDVAIVQTKACALERDGSVWCWGDDGITHRRDLPGPATELLYSRQGSACALLGQGKVAVWRGDETPRLALSGIAHLVACAGSFICGASADGELSCTDPGADGSKVGQMQQRLFRLTQGLSAEGGFAMNDYGSALCAWDEKGMRCVDAATQDAFSAVPGLGSIVEAAVGNARLGDDEVETAACARDAKDVVRCWDVAKKTTPSPLDRPRPTAEDPAQDPQTMPTPPRDTWSAEALERLAILGLVCAPAYAKRLKADGSIEMGCSSKGAAGDAPVEVVHGIEEVTLLRGNFRDPSSDDAMVMRLNQQTWLTRENGVWKKDHDFEVPFDTECRVADGGKNTDLLVCATPFTGAGGGRMDYVRVHWNNKDSALFLRMGIALDPWWMMCGGDIALGVRPSYFPVEWTLHQVGGDDGADLEVSTKRVGWTSSETDRLRQNEKFMQKNCECEGEAACDVVRPQVPTEKFVLTFLRQGDDFVPTPRTKRRLDEIKRQW